MRNLTGNLFWVLLSDDSLEVLVKKRPPFLVNARL